MATNTVTNEQESFFKAITKTSVSIEAVDPGTKTKTSAPVEAKTTTPATVKEQRNLLPIVGSILLGLLGLLLVIALGWFLFNKLGASTPSATTSNNGSTSGSTNSAPIRLENSEAWKAVKTSANSNGNFIGDFGGQGNGSVIPTEATDLAGKNWKVGRALLTYCHDASTCFFMFAKSGDTMPRAFNVNLYTPEFTGDLEKELPYVDTGWNNNFDVSWSYWTPVQ